MKNSRNIESIRQTMGLCLFVVALILSSASCHREEDDFVYIDCSSLFGEPPSTMDNTSLMVIRTGLHLSFIEASCVSVGRTYQGFINRKALLDTLPEKEFYYDEFVQTLTEYPELVDDLNFRNYQTSVDFEQKYGFFTHIQADEWICLRDHYYDDPKGLLRAADEMTKWEWDRPKFLVRCSLPGYSRDSLYALVTAHTAVLQPRRDLGEEADSFILLKKEDSIPPSYVLYGFIHFGKRYPG